MTTIIMPVYNVEERLLRKSIESVLEQTEKSFELLIIDDGSTDGVSEHVCDEYANIDRRVIVFHTDNKGVSAARNIGLENTKGEYIFFVDSDDYLSKDCLSNLLNSLLENNADLAMCAAEHVKDNNINATNEQPRTDEFVIYDQRQAVDALCYMEQPFDGYEFGAVWGCLYKKEAIQNNYFNENIRIGEDFDFKFRVIQNAKKIICVKNKLYYYLIRNKSAMRNGFDSQKIQSVVELEKYMSSPSIREEYVEDFRSRAVNIAIVILFMIPYNSSYQAYREPVIKFIKDNRMTVIRNRKSRSKVKAFLLLSFLGINLSQLISKTIG